MKLLVALLVLSCSGPIEDIAPGTRCNRGHWCYQDRDLLTCLDGHWIATPCQKCVLRNPGEGPGADLNDFYIECIK